MRSPSASAPASRESPASRFPRSTMCRPTSGRATSSTLFLWLGWAGCGGTGPHPVGSADHLLPRAGEGRSRMTRLLDIRGAIFLVVLIAAAIAVPILALALPPSATLHVPAYVVALLGKYLCYAL